VRHFATRSVVLHPIIDPPIPAVRLSRGGVVGVRPRRSLALILDHTAMLPSPQHEPDRWLECRKCGLWRHRCEILTGNCWHCELQRVWTGLVCPDKMTGDEMMLAIAMSSETSCHERRMLRRPQCCNHSFRHVEQNRGSTLRVGTWGLKVDLRCYSSF
jgi:hypothetical protein